jgi:DNA-binding transcriptional MerR regulator
MSADNGIHAALKKAGIRGLTTKGVADQLGVSTVTISRWRKAGLVSPQSYRHGKLTVYVFSDEDIQVCRDVQQRLRPGRRAAGDDSVRITKPPQTVNVSVRSRKRYERLQQMRKDRASADKAISPGDLYASTPGDGPGTEKDGS